MKHRYVAALVFFAFFSGVVAQGRYGIAGRILTHTGTRDWFVELGYLPPKPRPYVEVPVIKSMPAKELPCPRAPGLTLLITGQSNADGVATDSPNKRYDDIYVLHKGRCYQATDPAPGWGTGAAIWTALAEKLVRTKGPIVLASAFGDPTIDQFAPNGTSHKEIMKRLRELAEHGLRPDALLFQGGESDAKRGTPTEYFATYLDEFVNSLNGIPVYVARASLCGGVFSNAVRAAQKKYPGPDTDKIFEDHRSDGCHFNEKGRQKAAEAWFDVLKDTGLAN